MSNSYAMLGFPLKHSVSNKPHEIMSNRQTKRWRWEMSSNYGPRGVSATAQELADYSRRVYNDHHPADDDWFATRLRKDFGVDVDIEVIRPFYNEVVQSNLDWQAKHKGLKIRPESGTIFPCSMFEKDFYKTPISASYANPVNTGGPIYPLPVITERDSLRYSLKKAVKDGVFADAF